MSTTFRRCGSLALAAAGVALLAACATTTAGTAAVAPNATPRSSAVTTTERTTETTTPTTTRTTPPSTTRSTTSSSTPAITVRPTDSAGAPATATSTLLFDGDCFVFAGGDVTTIDCAQLHDGQVFKTGVALTARRSGGDLGRCLVEGRKRRLRRRFPHLRRLGPARRLRASRS